MSNYKKLLHVCSQAGCNVVIAGDKRYCAKHQAQHEAAWQAKKQQYRKSKLAHAIRQQQTKHYDLYDRDKEAKAFYQSRSWRQVRDYVFARDNATCAVCGNIIKDRKLVDHITPRRLLTPVEQLNTNNLWLLCGADHNRKTKIEQAISAQPNGDTKLRHLDREWWLRVLSENKGETITAKQWKEQHNANH